MFNENIEENIISVSARKRKPQKKITPQRLKNIALYYLKRFESSADNLRSVLRRRVDAYARENPQWNKQEAYVWIEDLLTQFENLHYLDDSRYAQIKIQSYLNAGKPARYIIGKLKAKGISPSQVEDILAQQEYNPFETALKFARRKKIGPFRLAESRAQFKQKDMAALVRAGFDYNTVCEVLNYETDNE